MLPLKSTEALNVIYLALNDFSATLSYLVQLEWFDC